mmetsp:Transcript_12163/g.14397  ORF Transcript_12163/g.14397 Transcript_12163/m.14397 type:complete len:84 (+) Transcript_12163:232-483(+)|eukprot:CAMPEP_0185620144 /NCGR_PEP_ID=MMETSP0436-20130131/53068_1 /TAXON_ID=626734 ORGANISM="Favella taraikaensis, Strain Fe Narragansett Bay" /NCGR_SAMPLE_ID=MMETSP0436 /ASSEMBLY_ACC=CAM_ASM_000390 /LENGTH=83 /DNA_ID=CAMNT_0028260253 /DNA_START=209 /DNA_END=460 /DNA_ORIENTATION=+
MAESKKKEEYIKSYERLYKHALEKRAKHDEIEAAQARQQRTRPSTAGRSANRKQQSNSKTRADRSNSAASSRAHLNHQDAHFA